MRHKTKYSAEKENAIDQLLFEPGNIIITRIPLNNETNNRINHISLLKNELWKWSYVSIVQYNQHSNNFNIQTFFFLNKITKAIKTKLKKNIMVHYICITHSNNSLTLSFIIFHHL